MVHLIRIWAPLEPKRIVLPSLTQCWDFSGVSPSKVLEILRRPETSMAMLLLDNIDYPMLEV
jgi:hypothetical protein